MKKIAQKIATVLVLVMLAAAFNGCVALGAIMLPVAATGVAIVDDLDIDIIGDIADAVGHSRYNKAWETVSQYVDIDTF